MNFSVIVPTLNAGQDIENLLSSLISQDSGRPELIVIDSSSDDDTVGISKRLGARTIVIPRKSFSHGGTRNMAAKEAKGDVLIFMTQDALPADERLLTTLASPLHEGNVAASFGRHVPRPGASVLEAFARRFNYPETGSVKGLDDIDKYGIKTFFFSNVCSAIKREAFFKIGMFPENVRLNEDMLISAKLIFKGYRIAYLPDAAVVHSHDYSLFRQFRRYFDIGSSLRHSPWLLAHIRPEGEGRRFIKEQLKFVAKRGRYDLIPYIFLESFIKYAGYRAGLNSG